MNHVEHPDSPLMAETDRLVKVELDEKSIGRGNADVEHERQVAIYDLLQENSFQLSGFSGPYELSLSIVDRRLVWDIRQVDGSSATTVVLSLTPLRRVVKDYFMICESYFQAIKISAPHQIEAIDMGRRGLHNEGTQILMERLRGKVVTDFDTARRLFTLVCVLHWRG